MIIDLSDHYTITCHYEDGSIETSDDEYSFSFDKSLHSVDGPAIYHHDNTFEGWWQYGNEHRLDGPAYWWIDSSGPLDEYYEEYWVLGEKIDKSLFYIIIGSNNKEDLLIYLLDNNKGIRYLAENRLKEIEN